MRVAVRVVAGGAASWCWARRRRGRDCLSGMREKDVVLGVWWEAWARIWYCLFLMERLELAGVWVWRGDGRI